MKNIFRYVLIPLCFLFGNSCEDALNVDPTLSISETKVLTSEANVKKLLLGTYEIAGNRNSLGGYLQIFGDLLGSDKEVSWNGTFTEPREALTKTMNANNFLIDQIWKNTFRIISQSNLIIDNLALIKDAGEKSRVEGEARFLRAFAHFELVRFFGSEIKGIPIRLSSVKDYAGDLKIKRNTTVEVYAAIQDDITKATALLPNDNTFYTGKYAALALGARVKLYTGNFAGALRDANDIISNSDRTLATHLDDVFNRDENGPEDIFSIQVTSQSGENQLIQMYASEENGGRGGDISLNDEFFEIFDDPNDERAHFYYENAKGDFLSSKYTNQFGNVPVLRLGEMLLIRAECNQRLNSKIGSAPLDDVNAIRERSGASPLSSITLNDILAERKRELAFEGMAIYDIKRTKKSVKGLPFNSPKLVIPIPQSELDSNSLMEQNEGY